LRFLPTRNFTRFVSGTAILPPLKSLAMRGAVVTTSNLPKPVIRTGFPLTRFYT